MTNEPNASEWRQAIADYERQPSIMVSDSRANDWIETHARELASTRTVPSTTQSELLPCPFCGETPTLDSIQADANQGGKWGSVYCCITGPEVRTGYDPVEKWRDKAIEQWNTRTAARESGQDEAFLVTQHELIRLTKENAELRGRIEGAPTTSAYLSNDDPPGCCFTSVAMVPMDWDGKTVALVTL